MRVDKRTKATSDVHRVAVSPLVLRMNMIFQLPSVVIYGNIIRLK